MTFHLIRKDGRYGIRTPGGIDTYTDARGRPYTKRTATEEAQRYANDGQPLKPKKRYCPVCRNPQDPTAIFPCRCPQPA